MKKKPNTNIKKKQIQLSIEPYDDNTDVIVNFLSKTHLLNEKLSLSNSNETLFNEAANFFADFGYSSFYVYKLNKEIETGFKSLFHNDFNTDYIDENNFSDLNREVLEKKALVIFELHNSTQFLIGIPIYCSLGTFVFYAAGSEKIVSEKKYTSLFELVISLVKDKMILLEEQQDVKNIKQNLEQLIEKKNTDLDRVVETLSQQYSELKYQHDKRVQLIQEIHHRVNNNLQVISSLLSLYISSPSLDTQNALMDVRNRVQVMALIHLNVYKSVEMNLIDFKSYLRDLFSYLRSVNTQVKLFSNLKTNVKTIKLDTLVPLGLLITEIVEFWLKKAHANGLVDLIFDITITKNLKTNEQVLTIRDEHSTQLLSELKDLEQGNEISNILLSALTEQLEGDFKVYFNDRNEFKFRFKD